MNKKIVTVILAFILIFTCTSTVYAQSYYEDDIERYIMEQMLAANIPGLSLSIVTSGREVYSAAFGDIPNTTSDMEIGALSKNITALAVMQLVEKGIISTDKKVSEYLTDYKQLGDVTISDLLNQTSGISKEQYLDEISSVLPIGSYNNANGNYNILGKVIEIVSGQSYSDYVYENIFEPLEMNSTYTLYSKNRDTLDFVEGHSDYFGIPIKNKLGISEPDGWIEPASCGIISDVKDMGKYLTMYLNAGGKVISYNGIEKMLSTDEGIDIGKDIFGTDTKYINGWKYTKKAGQDIYYCSGSIDGYVSSMFLMPSKDVAVTILCNSSDIVAGDKLIEKASAGVACLLINQKAKTIDSKSYIIPHIKLDILYLAAIMVSLMPLFTIVNWYKHNRKKQGIVGIIADFLIHLVLPTAAIFVIPDMTSSWLMLKRFIPDAYYISIAVICILYCGGIIKLILRMIIKNRSMIDKEYEASMYDELDGYELDYDELENYDIVNDDLDEDETDLEIQEDIKNELEAENEENTYTLQRIILEPSSSQLKTRQKLKKRRKRRR